MSSRRAALRLPRDRRGGGSLEFAMVALPFITFLLFLIEIGYDSFAQVALDYGVQLAARQIQLGKAQGVSTAAIFRADYLCPVLNGLLPCAAISINVTPVTTDFYKALPINAAGQPDIFGFIYCPGRPNQLMLVQAVYTSPSLVAVVLPNIAGTVASGFVKVTLASTAFINENFPVTAAPPAGC
jgi:Flp pilus assembly protein TadG